MQANMMPGDFVENQIGHSSLRVTSNYTHFEHQQKRAIAVLYSKRAVVLVAELS